MSKQITTGPNKIANGKVFVTLFRPDGSKSGELHPGTAINLFSAKNIVRMPFFSFAVRV
jgi:hypothetical protein